MRELFIDGLIPADTPDTLRGWFEPYGPVIETKIIALSIGAPFGYVTMGREQDGNRAIRALNGHSVGDRTLLVMWARTITGRAQPNTTATPRLASAS